MKIYKTLFIVLLLSQTSFTQNEIYQKKVEALNANEGNNLVERVNRQAYLNGIRALYKNFGGKDEYCESGNCINGYGTKLTVKGLITLRKKLEIGNFKNGKLNGKGSELFLDLKTKKFVLFKKGLYKNGLFDGNNNIDYYTRFNKNDFDYFEGSNRYRSSNSLSTELSKYTYIGGFKNGVKHGSGKLYNLSKKLIFEGLWKNGKIQHYKKNKLYYPNGQTKRIVDSLNVSFFSEKGNITKMLEIKYGYMDEPFIEDITKYHPNGKIKEKIIKNPYSRILYDNNENKKMSENDKKHRTYFFNSGEIKNIIFKQNKAKFFHKNGKLKYEGNILIKTWPETVYYPVGDVIIFDENESVVFKGFIEPKLNYIFDKNIKNKELSGNGEFYKDSNKYIVNFEVFYSSSNRYGRGNLALKLKGLKKYSLGINKKIRFSDYAYDNKCSHYNCIVKEKNRRFHPYVLLSDLINNKQSEWILYNSTFEK